ncbi:MAG: glycosyltransferase [bacterium]
MKFNLMINDRQKMVLVIAYFFPPERNSGSIQSFNILKRLPQFNWKPIILTIKQKYLSSISEEGELLLKSLPKESLLIRTNFIQPQQILMRIKKFFYPKAKSNKDINQNYKIDKKGKKGYFQKIKDFITDSLLAIPDKQIWWLPYAVLAGIDMNRRHKIDLIYAIGKPWTSFLIGYCLKKCIKKPLIINLMDPWMSYGSWEYKRTWMIEKIEEWIEKFIVKKVDFIVANTMELKEDFIKRLRIKNEKIEVITCGYEKTDFDNVDIEGKREDKFIITHTGTFYKKRLPINFLIALKELLEEKLIASDEILINFVGRISPKYQQVYDLMNEPHLKPIIKMYDWVPHKEAIEYFYQSDVLLLIQPQTTLQIPAKLYEYAASGKPMIIIGEKNGAVANLIKKEGWGDIIEDNDFKCIKKVISEYYKQFKNKTLPTRINRKNIEKYEFNYLAKDLTQVFNKIYQDKDRDRDRDRDNG